MEGIINYLQYTRIAFSISLNTYDESNLNELILVILILLKLDVSHREFLVRFAKIKVNRTIRQSIIDMNNIHDILIRLINITRVNNQQRNNRNQNNNNRNRNNNNRNRNNDNRNRNNSNRN